MAAAGDGAPVVAGAGRDKAGGGALAEGGDPRQGAADLERAGPCRHSAFRTTGLPSDLAQLAAGDDGRPQDDPVGHRAGCTGEVDGLDQLGGRALGPALIESVQTGHVV